MNTVKIGGGITVRNNSYNCYSFPQIHKLLNGVVRGYGLRILNNTFLIENIVQDAFLKLWEMRDTINSLEHAEAFLKQSVKWSCHAYFRHSASRFHRGMVQLDAFEDYERFIGDNSSDPIFESMEDEMIGQRLKQARQGIENLLYGRDKEVMNLHFVNGFTHAQIAARFGLSVPAVTFIIENGKSRLKTVLLKTQVAAEAGNPKNKYFPQFIGHFDLMGGLTKEQSAIYKLRAVNKYSFEQIATTLNLQTSDIRLEYVKAWKIVNNNGKAKKSTKNKSSVNNHLQASRLLSA